MRFMDMIVGLIGPSILFGVVLGVLFFLDSTLSASMTGLVGGIFVMLFVWGLAAVILKYEGSKARKLSSSKAN